MMDSGPVRNMWSILPNKFEKLCISLAFIIRTACKIIIFRLLDRTVQVYIRNATNLMMIIV